MMVHLSRLISFAGLGCLVLALVTENRPNKMAVATDSVTQRNGIPFASFTSVRDSPMKAPSPSGGHQKEGGLERDNT